MFYLSGSRLRELGVDCHVVQTPAFIDDMTGPEPVARVVYSKRFASEEIAFNYLVEESRTHKLFVLDKFDPGCFNTGILVRYVAVSLV